jgi:hypothetical protein
MLGLLFSLLLMAGKEQHLFRKLTGEVSHVVPLTGVVHQGLHLQDAQRFDREFVLRRVD